MFFWRSYCMIQFYRVQQFWPHNQCSPTHKVIALGLAQFALLLHCAPPSQEGLNSYLIFVTDSQTVSVEKKSVMWRNFKILYMTDVEKSKIHPRVDKLKFPHMTDVEKSEISFNMCTIYGILLHFKLF